MPPLPIESTLHQSLIESTEQAFFAYDVQNQEITYVSPSFQNTFGLSVGKVVPDQLLQMVHTEDRAFILDQVNALFQGLGKKILEFRIQPGEHSEEKWVCLQPFLQVKGEGQQFILGHAEDVTAQRRYNDHLKKFSNKKNSILNILAHDLAGPFAMIHNLAAQLIQDAQEAKKEDTLQVLQIIERSSKQGAQLLHEFMDQEFLESSETEVVTRRVNVVEKLREAMEEYEGAKGNLIEKQIIFLPSKEIIYGNIDDLKFIQILTNLISNSLKFTPDGGTITVTLEEEKDSILLQIADTGIGIPARFHDTLFDKFTQARRPGLKGEQSVGLGMSIVKTIVEWHKGQIWFQSEEGKGTTFYVRLPKG